MFGGCQCEGCWRSTEDCERASPLSKGRKRSSKGEEIQLSSSVNRVLRVQVEEDDMHVVENSRVAEDGESGEEKECQGEQYKAEERGGH